MKSNYSKARRDKGEGSVFQRNTGEWCAKYKPENSTKTKYFYDSSEKGVKRKLNKFKQEAIRTPYTVKKMSIKTYMGEWLHKVKIHDLKPKSFDTMEMTLTNHIFPFIGDLQIGSVTANDVQNMINELNDKGLSYSTIKKAYVAINECFGLGIDREEIVRNPCKGVSLPANRNKKNGTNFFDEIRATQICEMSKTTGKNGKLIYRLGHAVILLMYTGLRVGELLDLKWSDFDADTKTLTIDSSVALIKDRSANNTTNYILKVQDSVKTEASTRTVYLSQTAIAAIEELRKINGQFERIVCNAKGGIVDPTNFDRTFRTIQRKCGFAETHGVHILRHTFASMLFKKGVDVKTVSELLGHSSVQITYDIYIHLIKEQKQQAIALLDDL